MPPFQSPQTMIREDFVRIVLAGLPGSAYGSICRPDVRAHGGNFFYKRYAHIVLSIPAVSGVCIDTGSIAMLWPTYLAQTSAWLKATDFMAAAEAQRGPLYSLD